jgi:hypothetical protein
MKPGVMQTLPVVCQIWMLAKSVFPDPLAGLTTKTTVDILQSAFYRSGALD